MSFNIDEIEQLLTKTIGLEPESIGRKSIESAFNSFLKRKGYKNENDAFNDITLNKSAFSNFIEEITVSETWFCRDSGAYNLLIELVKNNNNIKNKIRPLRILSAPCSTGEEPYSIVINLLESGLTLNDFEIDAVDINNNSLEFARNGIYKKTSFRGDYSFNLLKYFTIDNNNYKINSNIISKVNFSKENIILDTFFMNKTSYDIIFSKNLLIYLNMQARIQVLENIKRLLNQDGILFTGYTETSFFYQFDFKNVNYPLAFALTKPNQAKQNLSPKTLPKQFILNKRKLFQKKVHITDNTLSKPDDSIKNNKVSPDIINKIVDDNQYTNSKELSCKLLDEIKVFSDIGKYDEALVKCKELLKLNYNCYECYYFFGLIYFAKNKIDISLEYFSKSLYLHPEHYESLIYLSLIFEQKGDIEKSNIYKNRAIRVHNKQTE